MIAERFGLDMDRAFALLCDHARYTNQRLTDVARRVIDSATGDFPPRPAGDVFTFGPELGRRGPAGRLPTG